MGYSFTLGEETALRLDKEDALSKYKDRFYLNEKQIYMDGNSLGLMSRDAEESLERLISEWKHLGINGWMGAKIPWFYYAEELAKLQAPLVGGEPEEVIIHSSTTVNLHAMLSTFFQPDNKRNKILMDDLTFPSDRYAVEGQLRIKGLDPDKQLIIVESKDGRTINEHDIVNKMSEEVQLILLPSVLYRSGQLLDIEYLTKEAHKRNIIIGFDCCHSVGAIPHHFSQWEVDFAFWCNYKYCNNGPGGTASIYINKKHFNKTVGLAGWFGYNKDKQFDMSNEFLSANNAGAWQIGTPHLLSMAPLEGSLKMFGEIGIDKIREKSLKITNYLMYLIDNCLTEYGFSIGTPREDKRRGGHVALEHEDAVRINEAMKEKGIIPDFRYPNVIRLAPIAFYTSYHDVWKAVEIIKAIMINKDYNKYSSERGAVS